MRKRVFFFIKSHFRERQWDTVENVPEGYEAIYLQNEKLQGSVKNVQKSRSFIGRLKVNLSLKLPMINFKKVPKEANQCDFIYTWGYLPIGAKKPFIIEMDNPYCLTYYNVKAFRMYKGIVRKFLERAHKLTFMSQASMYHFLHEFGSSFEEKCVVFYPFARRRYNLAVLNSKKSEVNFLFVGLNFRNKGGLELLEAFSAISIQNIRLYIVSFVPEEVRKSFGKDKRITFLEPMSRERLLTEIYPRMDVFIFPSLYESFGVVLLEALSFGLGLIATNVYAVPEMLYHGENGVLLHHPFLKPEKLYGREIVNPVKYHIKDFKELFLKKDFFYYSLYLELKEAIRQAAEEYPTWRKNSMEVFEEKFSEDVWERRCNRIFE